MSRRLAILLAATVMAFVLAPGSALASRGTQTFELHMEAPNTAQAPNGDQVAITGEGVFSVHPKSVEAEGEFTHTDSAGNVVAAGMWTATRLISYQSYGCGVVFG